MASKRFMVLATAAAISLGSITAIAPLAPSVFAASSNIGNGSITVDTTTINPGSVITVTGTGFDDTTYPYLALKIDRQDVSTDYDGDDVYVNDGVSYVNTDKLPSGGTFTFTFHLPDNISTGDHTLYVLSNSPQTSINTTFTVTSASTDSTSTSSTSAEAASTSTASTSTSAEAASTSTASTSTSAEAASTSTASTGTASLTKATQTAVKSLSVIGSGFTPNAALTVKVNGVAAQFNLGRSGTAASTTASQTGTFSGTVVIPDDTIAYAPTTNNTVELSDGTNTATLNFTGVPFLTLPSGVSSANFYPGATISGLTISNLNDGAVVTGIKAGDTNVATDLSVKASGGTAALPDITIPEDDSLVGKTLTFTYTYNGTTYTQDTGRSLVMPNTEINKSSFNITETTLATGLYQSVYNPVTKTVFVAVGSRGGTTPYIYELNPDTLAVIKQTQITNSAGTVLGNYGIAVDSSNGDIWVGHTTGGTGAVGVSLLDKDLNVKKQWLDSSNTAQHVRDIIVDPTTHLAYASAANRTNDLKVYDPNSDTPKGSIPLNDQIGAPMGMTFDANTRTIYTVGLATAKLAAINLDQVNLVPAANDSSVSTNPDPTGITVTDLSSTGLTSATGTAYDADNNTIYIAGQGNNGVVAYNLTDKTSKVIATGAQPVYVVYEPTHKQIWVSNFGSGTTAIIDATNNNLVGRLQTGSGTNALSVGVDGNVYVAAKDNVDHFYRINYVPASSNTSTDSNSTSTDSNSTSAENAQNNSTASQGIMGFINKNKLILAVLGILGVIAAGVGAAINAGLLILPTL